MSSSESSKPPFDPTEHPHRRYNPLTDSFVLCSPHRTKRPWQGAQEKGDGPKLPQYDPECYLCPGNERATGGKNDKYESTFFFENDYAALMPLEVEYKEEAVVAHPLLQSQPARGKCYVLCFHPSHNLTLAQLTTSPYSSESHILPIVKSWKSLYKQIQNDNPFVRYIQIFENKGSAMGCSNPHPHGQIWSLDYIPEEPLKTLKNFKKYSLNPSNEDKNLNPPKDEKSRPSMLLTYSNLELSIHLNSKDSTKKDSRVICFNDRFVAVVPYWATWPFEVLTIPYKRQIQSLDEMDENELKDLAQILGEVACRLDNIFECSFPYSMGIHQNPIPNPRLGSNENEYQVDELSEFSHFHIHYYPPLLRSATVRKFLVGFEMLGEPQRDLTAEQAAIRIRDSSTTHYLAKST